MAFLQRCLDDPTAADCGRCDTCTAPWYAADVADTALDAARAQLARVGVPIEPRGPMAQRGWTDWASRSRAGSPPGEGDGSPAGRSRG
jgi:ATP-dependent DNA helicase RecQ